MDTADAMNEVRRAFVAGAFPEARGIAERALAADPENVDLLYFAGVSARLSNDAGAARGYLEAAIRHAPDQAHNWGELGMLLSDMGELAEALDAFHRAIALAPDEVVFHVGHGAALQRKSDLDGAERAFLEGIKADPDDWRPRAGLASVLLDKGRHDEALTSATVALSLAPDSQDPWILTGRAYFHLGRLEDGHAAFIRAAVMIRSPRERAAWLGDLYLKVGVAGAALERFDEALTIDPDYVPARLGRIHALRFLGCLAEATAELRSLIEVSESQDVTILFYLLADLLNEAPPETMEDYQRDRIEWARRFAPPHVAKRDHSNRPDPDRKLRIGYIAATFCKNSSVELVFPIIAGHDPDRFEVSLFSNTLIEDSVTESFRAVSHRWFDIRRLSDERRASIIAEAGIDILVDIAGHSYRNCLLTLARKPAPIQITAWGFPTGTGMGQVDWIFADELFIRPEERSAMAEGVWYLPNWTVLKPPSGALMPGPIPARTQGHATFGSFCRTEKITDASLDAWAEILRRLPEARFLMKAPQLEQPHRADLVRQKFAVRGIDPVRVSILGATSKDDHLAAHHRVDLVLDAFPQVGGVSTFEALWMGVPVVTLYGCVMSGRGAASILKCVGLESLIAYDREDYIGKACALATDLDRLERIRAECRPRLVNSPAGNPKLYVAAVEDAYRQMWRRWCAERRR